MTLVDINLRIAFNPLKISLKINSNKIIISFSSLEIHPNIDPLHSRVAKRMVVPNPHCLICLVWIDFNIVVWDLGFIECALLFYNATHFFKYSHYPYFTNIF